MSEDRREALAEALLKLEYPDAEPLAELEPFVANAWRESADALMPLLTTWAAEDEHRGAERVRAAVEGVLARMDDASAFNRRLIERGAISYSTRQLALMSAECREGDATDIRAALDGARDA